MIKILWDWNGTLLDDLSFSLECIRQVQREYGVPPFESVEDYRRVFGFPVYDYYLRAGFDFSRLSWPEVGARFMELYVSGVDRVKLAVDAIEALKLARSRFFASYILSASRIDLLKEQIEMHDRLPQFLCGVYGIGDIYASSKEAAAREFLESCLPSDTIYLIGDTVHDAAVAAAIGASFIAVPSGHQPEDAFDAGTVFCASLCEAVRYIDARSSH